MAAEGPRDAFLKISKNSQKSQNSNFRILVHHFLCLCLLCIVKKNWLDLNKTDGGDTFWSLPPIAIMQVWTRHPRPMLCARRWFAASTNALQRARSTADDPIWQGMTYAHCKQVHSKTRHKFEVQRVRKFGIWARSELRIGHNVRRAFRTGGIRTWGHNRAVKTNRLVSLASRSRHILR